MANRDVRKILFTGDSDIGVEEGRTPSKRVKYNSPEKGKKRNRKKRRRRKKRNSDHVKFHPSVNTEQADFEKDAGTYDDPSQGSEETPASATATGDIAGQDWFGSFEWYNHTAIDTYVKEHPRNKIKVFDFSASIDEAPPTIFESTPYLAYYAPAFRASATIQIAPMVRQEKWKVGFIQAVSDSVLEMTYGDEGCLSWEIPELEVGLRMINDSEGHHYPWVGPDEQTVTFEGPCSEYQSATVSTSDSMHASTLWRYPQNLPEPNLSNMFREVTLNAWLVALNLSRNKAYVLKTVRWNTHLNVDVDPAKPLGQRATLRSGHVPRQPQEIQDIPIPCCALFPPSANNASMLLWRPRNGEPVCIVHPEHTEGVPAELHIDIDPYML